MKRLLALAVFAAVGLRPASCRGAGSAGADPLNFLLIDAGARPVAMGGAYTALARDSNALLYNPAGLGRTGRYEATFMHHQYFQGVNQEYASVAAPKGWGAHLIWLDFASVARTTLSNPDGTGLGRAGSSNLAFGLGYGKPLGDSLTVGAGVKLIRETLDGVVGQGYGLDLGALYELAGVKGLTLGAAIQNIGPAVRFQNAGEDLPLNVRGGAGYQFSLLKQAGTLSVDVLKERRDNVVVGAGGEVVVAKTMPVRLGFTTRAGAGPGITAGVGFLSRDFLIDYAFVPFGSLGNSHRVSATMRWGGPTTPAQTAAFASAQASDPPAAATRFAGAAQSPASILWTWTDHASNTAGYRVMSETTNLSGDLPPGTSSWLQTGLSPNAATGPLYVKAFNRKGTSVSNLASRYTLAAVPSELALATVSSTTIAVAWSAEGNPAGTVYELYRSLQGRDFAVLSRGTARSVFDAGLRPATDYSYAARAFNGDGVPSAFGAAALRRTGAD